VPLPEASINLAPPEPTSSIRIATLQNERRMRNFPDR
jgi:hypothetical protein